MRNVHRVIGMYFFRPPMMRMSPEPSMPCITEPAPRNRPALKNAWVIRWNTPAAQLPVPTATNMKPS